jgi:hypothetical protein
MQLAAYEHQRTGMFCGWQQHRRRQQHRRAELIEGENARNMHVFISNLLNLFNLSDLFQPFPTFSTFSTFLTFSAFLFKIFIFSLKIPYVAWTYSSLKRVRIAVL